MKTYITIFFLVLLSLVQTPVGQLLKLPLLIEHFNKHQKNEGISFFSFLEEHYASEHQDADLPEDEQLPFKNISFYAIGYAIVPEVVKANTVTHFPSDKKIIFLKHFTPQYYPGNIFHPPKW